MNPLGSGAGAHDEAGLDLTNRRCEEVVDRVRAVPGDFDLFQTRGDDPRSASRSGHVHRQVGRISVSVVGQPVRVGADRHVGISDRWRAEFDQAGRCARVDVHASRLTAASAASRLSPKMVRLPL